MLNAGGTEMVHRTIDEFELEPHSEGRSHIRISSASRTLLGRLLANEAATPFELPNEGTFSSLEGYWAFVKAGGGVNPLRVMDFDTRGVFGPPALRLTAHVDKRFDPQFRRRICKALDAKVEWNADVHKLLIENTLPLVRYDVIDGETFINPNQRWFMDHLEALVQRLKCRTRTPKRKPR